MSSPGVVVSARRATTDEVDVLVALATEARAGLADSRGGPELLALDDNGAAPDSHLDALLGDDDALVVAGLLDEVVVGYALVTTSAGEGAVTRATLAELYVEPGARQVGVGDAVLRHVLAWAAERGCDGLDGMALPGDRQTKNFFESHGMVARAIITHRSLSPEGQLE